MRVAFIIPSMYTGGAERVISILCNEFVSKGHIIALYLTENSTEIRYPLHDEVKVVDVSCSGGTFGAKVPGYIRNIKENLKKDKIDIVVSFITRTNIFSIIACRQLKIPIIVSERNNPYLIPSNLIFRLLRNIIYRYANGLVAQTSYAKAYFCKCISDKTAVIMNPVSSLCYENNTDFSYKDNVIVTACRLEPQKNVSLLIKAFSKIEQQIPHYKLLVYGDGSEREKIQKEINQYNLSERVVLKGNVDNVFKEVSKSKIFALTSNFEGLSNAVTEALCTGTVCVVTDSPTYGNRDLISDGDNGFLVPVGDADKLGGKILCLAKDEVLAAKLSSNARRLYEKVNCEFIVNQWEEYIVVVVNRCKK